MDKKITIITGTVGEDAHSIGSRLLSRVLKDNGFNVVERRRLVSAGDRSQRALNRLSEGEIERHLRTFDAKVDLMQNPLPKQKKRGKKPIGNQSFVDLRTELYRMSGIDFT